MADLVAGVLSNVVLRGLESVEQGSWLWLLDEDRAVISGGPRIDIAKQELQELEDDINSASFLLAAGFGKPQPIDGWISEARKVAFCLADQIDMYAIQGSTRSELYQMKRDIGMLRIAELTTRIRDYKVEGEGTGQMPRAVRGNREEQVPQLSELSPFIRRALPELLPAEELLTITLMDSKIKRVEAFLADARSVLFITGGQGSGKTTLMNYVYASQKEKTKAVHGKALWNDFNQCCWVDVAKTGGLVDLLKKVLKESNVGCDSIHEFEMIKTVHDNFKDKNYLIVLDNVQDTSVLYSLKNMLNELKGKIICLTRRKDIQEDKNQDVLHITKLEPYESFKLFLSVVFHMSVNNDKEDFNSVLANAITDKDAHTSRSLLATDLKKMVKLLNVILSKCQDNPWNIRSIGTQLEANPLGKWNEIGNRIDGMIIDDTKKYGKRDPPVQLEDASLANAAIRHCFLYCLAFPVTSENGNETSETGNETSEIMQDSGGIPTRKLIRLWTAEGYVQDSENQEQAECLLEELIKKNLLVVKKKDFDGKVLKCSVNEHVRPLAERMCEQQKFCKVVIDDGGDEESSTSRVAKCFPISPNIRIREKKKPLSDRYRMLAVHGDRGVTSETLGKDIRLRSLLHFKTGRVEHSDNIDLSFRRTNMLLRTLDLEGARLAYLPSSIDSLVCLRYLGLRNTQLEDLPQTLPRHLLCLDIRDTHVAELADVSQFSEMRHLYLTKSFRSHSVVIREGLQSLTHLQTLSGAAYRESSGRQYSRIVPFEQELSHLRRLRKLSMKKTSSASSKNICDAINGMDFLNSLAISCEKDGRKFDLSHLKIGKNLRKLKLGGPLGKFPVLQPLLQSITFLYLWDNELDMNLLDALKGLKNLLVLVLLNASTSDKMVCDNGYEKLKKLCIMSMENLSECKFGQNAMGNLEELVFASCDKLKRPPPELEHLGSLREVLLSKMPSEFCEDAIIKKVEDKVHVLPELSYDVSKIPSHMIRGAATEGDS
ncbi:disease resistance RPP8-like protein 3 [Brachypodium distachyon]|uniref:Uncharacterized protein n=1 Tax=Brachypodium distachyon TaxID=15368 RepID=I1GWR9_BRADI|nr:disease resistance RPP8-like protein 3 [Brachypodium distachyon]XP_024318940.1 disease resistance RPP8-like protein 3 [Brachypodium distachyon]XP_024318957.1 disease resistance RPP8-like protein 3 [Brachypodium distachyon]XP_024318988.1 disease resistance RPP8-like protein 3 [Brachypodium distachyon]KQK17430.1 hypothetical protein BRADI_1g34430v3 [Brachypodium distachyon]|eukprot:XP_003560525.1 disease resistance RPP8-like protein 3 [Brachypodium distachyon]